MAHSNDQVGVSVNNDVSLIPFLERLGHLLRAVEIIPLLSRSESSLCLARMEVRSEQLDREHFLSGLR
jgi:hypothetical protein